MADDNKTFTEQEHIAILADRVAKETASLTGERDKLSSEKAELESKLDVAESAKVAAEQAKEAAEKELADFKAGLDALAEQESRKDERLAKVKEVAAHLGEDFLKDEARVARIVAMEGDAFDGYVSDLAAAAPPAGTTATAPRETAMVGASAAVAGTQGAPSAGRSFLLGRYIPKGD